MRDGVCWVINKHDDNFVAAATCERDHLPQSCVFCFLCGLLKASAQQAPRPGRHGLPLCVYEKIQKNKQSTNPGASPRGDYSILKRPSLHLERTPDGASFHAKINRHPPRGYLEGCYSTPRSGGHASSLRTCHKRQVGENNKHLAACILRHFTSCTLLNCRHVKIRIYEHILFLLT